MHLPPAVSYEVVRSGWHLFIGSALTTMAAVGTACFRMQQVSMIRPVGVAGIALGSTGESFLAWRRSPVGLLQWDGSQWLWPDFGDVPVQSVNLCLDFQFLMLLELKSDAGKTTWLFLEERFDHARWLALRRAIAVQGRGLVDPESELRVSAHADS